MQFGIRTPSFIRTISLLSLLCVCPLSQGQGEPRNHVVEISARPDSGGILLTWRGNSDAQDYTIYRRSGMNSGWDQVASLGGDATNWRDDAVAAGTGYEYRIDKRTSSTYTGFGFVSAGIDVTIIENRGRLILVVESGVEGSLSSELTRLRSDLMGEGWQIVQFAVSNGDSPPSVRDRIRSAYNQDPSRTKAVFLIGHVPVPYSGNIAPDGHENHRGAWPADVYYGDIDGNWTDSEVNSEVAEREINRNRPGDGKFDQSKIPSSVELAVGRVDFWQMTSFANKTPSRSELDLLRAYLNKNHEFRHGRIQVERRGLILDNFGLRGTNAVSGSGWRNFSGFFGLDRVSKLELDTYFPTLRDSSALFTWGAGGGSYYYSSGIGTSDDLALNDLRVIFTLWLGSYYGDWNNESNFLRAALGSGNVLVSMFAGLPQAFLHPMAMGATIGDGLLVTQNNKEGDGYFPDGQGVNEVHISLHGDPTLRLHPVLPPRDLQASGSTAVQLSWNVSQDTSLLGYHIFRSKAGEANFQRITSDPITTTSYTDRPAAGDYSYMVRAVKREQSGSGTYLNLSQATAVNASTSGQTVQPPAPPSNLAAVAQSPTTVELSWSDASSNESSFRIERRAPTESQFREIANVSANVTTYTDSSVLAATTYAYRVRARNQDGDSPYTAEVQVTTPQNAQPPAPPSSLAAVAASYIRVVLSWTDASSDETSFLIERRSSTESQFQEIASTAPNATSYTDNSVLPSTAYRYRLRARNTVGDSAYAAEAQVTTGSAPQPTASVSFLGLETSLGGNWPDQFGDDGTAIPELATLLPSNVSLQLKSGALHLWQATTADPRAVRKSASDPSRIASAWFDPQSVKIDFTTAESEDVALYFLDWDRAGRVQDLSVLDTGTGIPLYQLALDTFAEGKYVQLRVQGAVTIQLAKVSGPNALLNALFVGGPSVGVPITAPSLSAQITASGMNIRLTVAAGSRFVLERTTDFENWGQVGEFQGTGAPTDISRSTRFTTEFFRVRLIE